MYNVPRHKGLLNEGGLVGLFRLRNAPAIEPKIKADAKSD
jgi:hypothetical protein